MDNQPNLEQISIESAAGIMGKSKQFIRVGLQKGLLPFGTAVKMSSTYTYYISPKKFFEYTGINPKEVMRFEQGCC